VTVVDTLYGRRAGRWITHQPGRLLAEIRALIARARADGTWERPDLSRLFHPDTIAATRAHQRHCGGRTHPLGDQCPSRPHPADLAAIWDGRARMAAARRAAGQPLDPIDVEALARREAAP
jgi:hypothetical protein